MRINGFTWSLAVACLISLYSFNMQPTNALRCYSCSNCGDSVGQITQCSESENACMKLHFGETIMKYCTEKSLCNLKSVESNLKDMWSSIRNAFGGTTEAAPTQDAINCCETSYCNSAPSFVATSTLMIVSIAALKFLF